MTVHTSNTLEPVCHKQLQEACRPTKLCSHFDCFKMFPIYVTGMCQDIRLPISGIVPPMNWSNVSLSMFVVSVTMVTYICTTLAGQHTWQNCTCKCNPTSYQTPHVRSNEKILKLCSHFLWLPDIDVSRVGKIHTQWRFKHPHISW